MFHSHLGDDPAVTANPAPIQFDTGDLPLQPAVIPLTNPATALPTNGADPLATSNAQNVPTTPASPMQATPPAALAVMDPNQYQQPQILPPMTVAPPNNMNLYLALGGAALLAYLVFGKKGGSKGRARGKSGRYRRSKASSRLRRIRPYFA